MEPTGGDAHELIAGAKTARRRADGETLLALMAEVSGRDPVRWGTIVGFGAAHYSYPTGRTGETPLLAFAPRSTSTTVYLLDGVDAHADALTRLGPHTTGAGCLYLKDLGRIDEDVLRGILERSLAWAEAGGGPGMSLTVTD